MSGSDPDPAAAEHASRAEELSRAHQVLREQRARTGDFSAQVHDEAARVHERLGDRSRLDPAELRAHAERDREMAREERAALAEEQAEQAEQRSPT